MYLDKLKVELDLEKQQQIEKRKKEMLDAQKIIKENEKFKKIKDNRKKTEKEEDAKLILEQKRLGEE